MTTEKYDSSIKCHNKLDRVTAGEVSGLKVHRCRIHNFIKCHYKLDMATAEEISGLKGTSMTDS